MRLLTYHTSDGLALGVKVDSGVLDVQSAANALGLAKVTTTPEAFFTQGLAALPDLEDLVREAMESGETEIWTFDEAALTLGPSVYNPEKILCVGLNYRQHAAESGSDVPDVPVLFSKFNNALNAHGAPITVPKAASQYDYEVELAVVIGKTARNVPEDQALDYVLGYCNANDVSARDLQKRTSQWLLGKTLNGFCPIGPYLVTSSEVTDPQQLDVKSWLNGEPRQDSNTSDMVFTVAEIISYISQYLPLKPGDVILTGTPEGVILGMDPKVWMKPGDEVTIEVEGLGRLTNRLIEET
jgi:2-keto-4-pentenoate hydratase/2-oxohepta-3-ene-1,7-dioic acid hydratase in catechol pathway